MKFLDFSLNYLDVKLTNLTMRSNQVRRGLYRVDIYHQFANELTSQNKLIVFNNYLIETI